MALRTQIMKIGVLVLSLSLAFWRCSIFNLFGMVTAYKMIELKRNLSLAAYLPARKTYLQ